MRFQLQNCSAIITGASSGLGAEFARQLAPLAMTMVLAARREEALEEVRKELLAINPSLNVIVCACDISTDEGRARLLAQIEAKDAKPNLLINNAGAGDYGSFASGEVARAQRQIDLNITALVVLTHSLLRLMPRNADRPAGIINVSSLAATLPMPGLAVYAATKSFVTSFSEALRVELAHENVVVSAVCPGPTPTNFGNNARRADGSDTNRSGQELIRMTPQSVVACALDALSRDKACVYPGLGVRIASLVFRLLPRFLMRRAIAKRFHDSRD